MTTTKVKRSESTGSGAATNRVTMKSIVTNLMLSGKTISVLASKARTIRVLANTRPSIYVPMPDIFAYDVSHKECIL